MADNTGRGGGTGDVFSDAQNKTAQEHADALEDDTKASNDAAKAYDKLADSVGKLNRKIEAATDNLGKFKRGQKALGQEASLLDSKLAKTITNFTSLSGSLGTLTNKFKPLTILTNVYKLRLAELARSQKEFNGSLFLSTKAMGDATNRHQKYLTTIKNAHRDAIDLANKYNVSSTETQKTATELTAAFTDQIMAYGNNSDMMKKLQEQTLVFAKTMGVDSAQAVAYMRQELDHSGRTMQQVQQDTWAVVKAADEYAGWLEKIGDKARRVANIHKKDMLEAIQKTTQAFKTGKFEQEGYVAMQMQIYKHAKKMHFTKEEAKAAAEQYGQAMAKMQDEGLSAWENTIPGVLQRAVQLAMQGGDKELVARVKAQQAQNARLGIEGTPQGKMGMLGALKGTVAMQRAQTEMMLQLPRQVVIENLRQRMGGDQRRANLVYESMKQGGLQKLTEAMQNQGKGSKRYQDEMKKWQQEMIDASKAGHDVQDLQYKAVTEIRKLMQSIDKYLGYYLPALLVAAGVGAAGSVLDLFGKGKLLGGVGKRVLGWGAKALGGAGAAGETASVVGAGAAGEGAAGVAAAGEGVAAAGEGAAGVAAAGEGAAGVAAGTAAVGEGAAGVAAAGEGAAGVAAAGEGVAAAGEGAAGAAAGSAALGPAAIAAIAAIAVNEIGGRVIKSRMRESDKLLYEGTNNVSGIALRQQALSYDNGPGGFIKALLSGGQGLSPVRKGFRYITRTRGLVVKEENDKIRASLLVREKQLEVMKKNLRTKEGLTHNEDKLMREKIRTMKKGIERDKKKVRADIEFDREEKKEWEERRLNKMTDYMKKIPKRLQELEAKGVTGKAAMQQVSKEMMEAVPWLSARHGSGALLRKALRGEGGTIKSSVVSAQLKEALGGEQGLENLVGVMSTEQRNAKLTRYRRNVLLKAGKITEKQAKALWHDPRAVAKAWMQAFPTDKSGHINPYLQSHHLSDISEDLKERVRQGKTLTITPVQVNQGGEAQGPAAEIGYDPSTGILSIPLPGQTAQFTVDGFASGVADHQQKVTDQHK